MFSKDITSSDSFLNMSATAQNLYFHLGMEADDDGFVPYIKVSKMLGTSHDDIAQLIGRGFILQFSYGVYVIRDWRINNQIRTDRYKPTIYQDEFAQLGVNKSQQYYIENKNIPLFDNDNQSLVGKPDGNQMTPIGKPSIGKVRLGKVSNTNVPVKTGTQSDINRYIEKFNNLFNRDFRITLTRTKKLKERLKVFSFDQIEKALENMSLDSFYSGNNDRNWSANPEFLIRSDEQVDNFLNKEVKKRSNVSYDKYGNKLGGDKNDVE